jgi:uncharacterized membrane protein
MSSSPSPNPRRLFWSTVGLSGAALLLSVVAYPHLPAVVATHWDLSGRPNGYSSRLFAVLIGPVMMVIVGGALAITPPRDVPFSMRDRHSGGPNGSGVSAILVISMVSILAIHALMLAGAGLLAANMMGRVGIALASLIFIALGNYMPRVTDPSSIVGLRLPWVYESDEVWRRSQRAAGYGLVASGTIGLVALVTVPKHAAVILFVALFVILVAVSIHSYRIAHDSRVS